MASRKKAALVDRFLRFVGEQKLIGQKEKVLLTVSGGVDSVVMAHLFHEAGFKFGVAHCNFNLRGEESNEDASFVRTLAKNLGAPYFEISFNTSEYAAERGLSIQMAARDLRYNWFHEVAEREGFELIATAHHKDDAVETVLLNLVKGSVLNGLGGIPISNGNVIRPLLFTDKAEILQYAAENDISYREDASNSSDKYARNLIRNQVIPLLGKINPSLIDTISETAVARTELAAWMTEFIEESLLSKATDKNGERRVPLAAILEAKLLPIHLYHWLGQYGFHYSEIKKLFAALGSTEALEFRSTTHRIVKERNELILSPISHLNDAGSIEVTRGQEEAALGGNHFEFTEMDKPENIDFENKNVAWLDADKLTWPLTIRAWLPGEYFYPAGFGKRKKLSDYLTDIKLGKTKKEKQLVLISGNDIVWVVGQRVDERYKGDLSPNVLKIVATQ